MVGEAYKSNDGSRPITNRSFGGAYPKAVDTFHRLRGEFVETPEIPRRNNGARNAKIG